MTDQNPKDQDLNDWNEIPVYQPSWRKPAGMFAIIALITLWVVIVASFSDSLAGLPVWLQLIIYVVTGLVWIAPLKPLLAWMETGRWFPRAD